MRIINPQREAETVWVHGAPFNRVDIERGVFRPDNMQYLTGEYEAFLYSGQNEHETIMRVSLECEDPDHCDTRQVRDGFLDSFLKGRPALATAYADGSFKIVFWFPKIGGLELHNLKGRPKRLVDRR